VVELASPVAGISVGDGSVDATGAGVGWPCKLANCLARRWVWRAKKKARDVARSSNTESKIIIKLLFLVFGVAGGGIGAGAVVIGVCGSML
jgi:hypothetical protein